MFKNLPKLVKNMLIVAMFRTINEKKTTVTTLKKCHDKV